MSDISVFIDTNVAQSFVGNNVFLSRLGVPNEYYNLISFLTESRLDSKVTVFFPEVVVNEMKAHMKKCFDSCIAEIDRSTTSYSKIFGDLIDIQYTISVKKEDYPEYVDRVFAEFFSNPRNACHIAEFPHNESIVGTLLEKAIAGVRPFFTGKVGGKNHSDAGFKDSLIAETIFSHCNEAKTIGILISNDGDYGTVFENRLHKGSKFVLFRSYKDTIDALKEYYCTDPSDMVQRKFEEDTYLHERILDEANVQLDLSVSECKVEDVSKIDDIYKVKISFVVNETIYKFDVEYDNSSNDIVDCRYEIEND